ncbi:MAG: PASTA domain-containing protein [Bacteroidales bacterium]
MKILKFIFSKVFLINISIMLVVSVVLLYVALEFLKVYTQHGEFVIVPNLVGKTVEELRNSDSICQDIELIVSDSLYDESFKTGLILRQIPEPNSEVKRERKIYLTINMAEPQKELVPNVRDLSFRQAEASISSAGFFVGEVIYIPSKYKGLVLHQKLGKTELLANDSLPLGSRIDLYVGSGSGSSFIEVPSLVGATLAEAETILKETLLNKGASIYDESVIGAQDTVKARICKYKPSGSVEQGSFIDLYLTVVDSLIVLDTLKEPIQEEVISVVE